MARASHEDVEREEERGVHPGVVGGLDLLVQGSAGLLVRKGAQPQERGAVQATMLREQVVPYEVWSVPQQGHAVLVAVRPGLVLRREVLIAADATRHRASRTARRRTDPSRQKSGQSGHVSTWS